MNKYGHNCSRTPKRKSKKRCNNKKLGFIMFLLGTVTALAIFLPLKWWVLILSFTLAVCGIILLKSQ